MNFKIDFRKQWHFFRFNKENCYDMLIVWYSDSVMFLLSDEKQLQQSKLKLTGNHLGFFCCCRVFINISDISHDKDWNLHFYQVPIYIWSAFKNKTKTKFSNKRIVKKVQWSEYWLRKRISVAYLAVQLFA